MEKLKIVINGNEHTASKAKELFSKLGYHISSQNRNNAYGWSLGDGVGDYYGNKKSFDEDVAREITIQQLRDMVVLKRNDVGDATHTDQDNWKWFISSNGTGYVFACGNSQNLQQWDEAGLDMVDLKPIMPIKEKPTSETEPTMQEQLDYADELRAIGESVWSKEKHAHYKRDVSHLNTIDPYRIADLYSLHPCAEHIMKKSLCAGGRGHKDLLRDIQDIIDTAERWKEMIEEDNCEV